MKQELHTNNGHHNNSLSPSPAARALVSRTRDSTIRDSPNGSSSPEVKSRPRAASAALEPNTNSPLHHVHVARRSIEKDVGEEAAKIAQRRPTSRDVNGNANVHVVGELQRKLEASEVMVKGLQSEVVGLKDELQISQEMNSELEAQKRRMAQDLLAAQERIKYLEKCCQEMQNCRFRHTQNTITSTQSEQFKLKEASIEDSNSKPLPDRLGATLPKMSIPKPAPPPPPPRTSSSVARPPPPPPPPKQGSAKLSTVNKATALVELYNSITKRDVKKASIVGDVTVSAHHNGIVGELQNRSAHLLAIKADVETKGEFINHLVRKVQTSVYTNIEDVLTFVDWLDRELSTLSDETAVLKHFNWPERKADTLREAAFEYRDLKSVLSEVASCNDDETPIPFEATLRKISNLLDKLEKSMTRVINLRNSAMQSYREFRIPTEWMIDSGIPSKLKLASVKLAKAYMKRVLLELDTSRNSEREVAHEALLAQSVRFAYRVYQFAGGLDSEAMRAFEELRERSILGNGIQGVAS